MTGYKSGLLAEFWALFYLLRRGYWPCAWRYKTRVGEIDLIVRRGRMLVFIEVKYRGADADALYALQPRQSRRLQRAAMYFLSRHAWAQKMALRFDLVAVSRRGHVQHLDNVV
ncbi:MAG: YraN family protein [Pseudomonadota bacterium]